MTPLPKLQWWAPLTTALTELDRLSIYDNRVSDLSPLAKLDNPASLAVFNHQVIAPSPPPRP